MTAQEQQLSNISKHQFDSWSKNLMDTLPVIDLWQKAQVGPENNGPYRAGYQSLAVLDNGEPLVSCLEYGLVNKDYYLHKAWDLFQTGNFEYLEPIKNRLLWPIAWVRLSVAEKLSQADQLLRKHGLFILVGSGWRHPDIQNLAATQAIFKLGEAEVKKLFSTKSPHATGGAVDLELHSLQTHQPLSFSYPEDIYGFYSLEEKNDPNHNEITKRNVRRILYHVLTPLGFTIHPGEFWHFGYGDPLSAYLSKQTPIYAATQPPASTQLTHFQV